MAKDGLSPMAGEESPNAAYTTAEKNMAKKTATATLNYREDLKQQTTNEKKKKAQMSNKTFFSLRIQMSQNNMGQCEGKE